MNRMARQSALLVVLLIVFAILLLLAPLTQISFWGIDIYTFRAAAKAMWLGADPYYTPNIQRFADGVIVGNIHDYLYAPYFAFALQPLALLPPELVSRFWFGLNLLLYFVSIGLLLLTLRWSPKQKVFLGLIVALILYPPLRTTLVIGQSTILLLFFFSLSIFLWRRDRPLLAGIIFSLGLFKPHLFPLLLFFALYRQWRWLGGVAVGLLLLNLPLWLWLDNWYAAATAARTANLAIDQCFQMVSLVSLANCLLPWPSWLNLGGIIVLAILLLTALYRFIPPQTRSSTSDQIFERRLAVYFTIFILAIDHTRIADQMLLVFPLLVIWRDWPSLQSEFFRRLAIGLMLLIYLVPYSLDFLGGRSIVFLLPFWYIIISIVLLTILLLQWRITLSSSQTWNS